MSIARMTVYTDGGYEVIVEHLHFQVYFNGYSASGWLESLDKAKAFITRHKERRTKVK